ncbi:HD-GYP domain-containing protein [Anaeroselena agilis]|uniref:HD domain-containing protein n=1 Tax=Anaeroselena agilis TaxID=3063788 RepID=A0ABU3P2E6_9FIRM|nr:HD domain-containing protein [Selenomonadales bacterium 4137-cl]
MIFNIYLTNLLKAFSLALELTDGGLSRHHWRTAMVADRIGGQIGLAQGPRQNLLYAALLHDIGAASRWDEKNSLYSHKPITDLYWHAEEGYRLLVDSPLFKALAKPIRHHHDRWDGSSPSGLAGKDLPLAARIINLADTFEVLINDGRYILDQREDILAAIVRHSGSQFDPDLVEALGEAAYKDSFWFDLATPHYFDHFFHSLQSHGQVRLNIDGLLGAAEIFATIVDRTSRFTATHSRTVAAVASFLAGVKGYSDTETKIMRVAGLLHDLGKLTVPNQILEKPGKLTPREFTVIKQHAYYTHRILTQVDGFELIAEWAAFHHETLDGTGYPFRIPPANLRLGCRIVAVADVYAALREDRPYRPSMPLSDVEKIMLDMAAARRLDADIVHTLFAAGDTVEEILPGTCPA